MSGIGPFTAKGHMSQDFGPGISAEPDSIWIRKDSGGWLKGRPDKFEGATKRNDIHLAIDISCPVGTNVLAPKAATIVSRNYDSRSGYYILGLINDSTLFGVMHLDRFVAKVGEKVAKGEVIAKTGDSGLTTGPHAHCFIRHYDRWKEYSWRSWYTRWFGYNPERLMPGGDLIGVGWMKP